MRREQSTDNARTNVDQVLSVVNSRVSEMPDAFASAALYSYGVYTSFTVEDRRVLAWGRHVDRLVRDAAEFLGVTVSRPEVAKSVSTYLDARDDHIGALTVRVSVYPQDLSIAEPGTRTSPLVLVTGRSGSSVASTSLRLATHELERAFTQFKVTNIAAALRTRADAQADGFDDALFLSGGGVCEGPTWNFFAIRADGSIVTPPLTSAVLPGVTRSLIIDSLDVEVFEQTIDPAETASIAAAFVTNSVIGARPVASINGVDLDCDYPSLEEIRRAYSKLVPQEIG